jgi:hypothetical protein
MIVPSHLIKPKSKQEGTYARNEKRNEVKPSESGDELREKKASNKKRKEKVIEEVGLVDIDSQSDFPD